MSIEVFRPNGFQCKSEAQQAWLDSIGEIDFLLGGGSAGSLKTSTMLIDAIQELDNPNLNAVIFRETHKAIKKDIELQAYQFYSQSGGTYNASELLWKWPWGARVQFGYLEQPKDVYNWYGSSISFLGVDESTFHLEEPIRHLMTMRVRSTDPSLKLRIRLGTNPGQKGADWHMGIFMGSHCTHCYLDEQSRIPYKIYNDARWPSDGKLITGPDGVTALRTCFIPSWVTEHDLYGAGGGGYAIKLEGLPERLRKALLEGCWASFEGQYFDCFDIKKHCIPYSALFSAEQEDDSIQWWWPFWVSMDYGFGESHSSAHLHTKSPRGRTYTIDEVILKHADAPAAAEYLKSRWVGRTYQDKWGNDKPTHICAWFLSPDAWQSRGMRSQDGHNIAEQMIAATGLPFEHASNDRAGGAMLMYGMLMRGQWVICADKCPELVKALQTRIHDPERPEDVLKIKGDKLDDVYDDTRYGLYSFVQKPRKPREVLVEEAMTSSDPTVAMIQRAIVEAKFKKITSVNYRKPS
jgi:hypothetical protein